MRPHQPRVHTVSMMLGGKKTGIAASAGRGAGKFWLAIVAAAVVLGGCATAGGSKGLVIEPLSHAQYPATQTVDVLNVSPGVPYESLARMTLSDPTGSASSAQLIAQMSEAAKSRGANALWIQRISSAGQPDVAFNPAGGQMQGISANGSLSISALAIRYTK